MRLIDADALSEALAKLGDEIGEDMADSIFYTNKAPTIEAVPVVYCRDCTHRAKDKTMKNVGTCLGRVDPWKMHREGYCSEAEKRIGADFTENPEQVVEIIRCKDCKHWIRMRDRWFCTVHGSYENCTPDDFCSRGRAK